MGRLIRAGVLTGIVDGLFPPTITIRWWIQLIGYFPFVGLPIVASIARALARKP